MPCFKRLGCKAAGSRHKLYICVFCARHPNPAHRPPAKTSLHIQAARTAARTDRANNDSCRCRIIRRLQVPVLCSRHLCRSQHSCGSLQLSCKTCPDRRNFGRTACCPLSAPYKLPPRRAKDLRLVQPRVSARLRIETRPHETQHAQKGKGANGQSPSVAVQQRTTEIEMRARERRRPGSGWAEARVCLLRPPACVFDEGDGGSQGRQACARGQERGHAHGPCSEGQTSFPRACGSYVAS